MKYFYTLLCLFLLSCNDVDFSLDDNNSFSSVTFKVNGKEVNRQAKIRTLFIESGFFKFDDTYNIGNLPFKKGYSEEINFAASLSLEYEDKTIKNFNSYLIDIQMFRDNVLIQERAFMIDYLGKKVNFDVMINK
ncbi:hypothetical protein CXF68_12020 [Tenacibaculum sp. Bg11-29]|uniref:hypothetical protein n=1 Tax=Tenacibaculum sp. Bg11-29 TaxID=2058306 RepID=UPI000C33A522|nr:hypothetical protein [Tenacibaculum sp. Bg11-29]PKH51359.1 hypothetical protein CXF68_12020 [Tenacibaculum sp. Bg11-29]